MSTAMRTFISALSLAACASAATITIAVGQNGKLAYNPNSFTAAVGDTLEFNFYSFHSVVSSSFSTPCQPGSDFFYSGSIAGETSGTKSFVTTVNSTDPIWFYCSVADHCNEGMVGVVNPPSGQTVDEYAMAAQQAAISQPAAVAGGQVTVVGPASASSTVMSTSSAADSTTSAMTTSETTSEITSMSTSSIEFLTSPSVSSGTEMSAATTTSSVPQSSSAATVVTTSTTPTTSSATMSSGIPNTTAGSGSSPSKSTGALVGVALFAGALVALMA